MLSELIRRLNDAQRRMLIEHIDGPVSIDVTKSKALRNSLLTARLLQCRPLYTRHPNTTELTEAGRKTVGAILGDCADTLVRAGLLPAENPMDVLRAMKAAREPESAPFLAEVAVRALKLG